MNFKMLKRSVKVRYVKLKLKINAVKMICKFLGQYRNTNE